LKRQLEVLNRYAAVGPEQAREATRQIFGIENNLKAVTGIYNGLLDKTVIAKRQKEEADFRDLAANNPGWNREYGPAWEAIAQAEKKYLERLKPARFRTVRASSMAQNALTIVQYVAEMKKPDGKRLGGFHDSQLESLRFRLFSPAPIYPRLEQVLLADSLRESLEELGPSDPFIQAALEGRSPREAIEKAFAGTKLADPPFRRSLIEGGEQAVAASTDPLITPARKIDPSVREVRKWFEDNIESVKTTAGERPAAPVLQFTGSQRTPTPLSRCV